MGYKMNYNTLDYEDFEAILIKEFPELYINMYGSEYKTCLSCGLETPNGWNNIIYELSKKIYNHAKENRLYPFPVVEQVKEKFGSLRYYISDSDKTIDSFIRYAEHLSETACFKCGTNFNKIKWSDACCDKCKKE
jgi:hypothetical protein